MEIWRGRFEKKTSSIRRGVDICLGWSLEYQGSPLSGQSLIGWSLLRAVSYQEGSLIRAQGSLSSGWSLIGAVSHRGSTVLTGVQRTVWQKMHKVSLQMQLLHVNSLGGTASPVSLISLVPGHSSIMETNYWSKSKMKWISNYKISFMQRCTNNKAGLI